MSEALLRIQNLDKSFFGVKVLRDVGLELHRGRVLGLVGENGSGKSTTMNILGGIHQKDAGRIEFDGREIAPQNSLNVDISGSGTIYLKTEPKNIETDFSGSGRIIHPNGTVEDRHERHAELEKR